MYVKTPVIVSKYLGDNVYLKLENSQPTGSFKSRGISAAVEAAAKSNKSAHFYCSSGGNAGIACAEAAYSVNRPCTIIVPEPTPEYTVERIESYGAKVQKFGESWFFADEHLHKLMKSDPNGYYVHPFDDEKVWEGHSTLVDELVEQLPEKPGAIVLAVGGGGLYIGVMTGLIRHGWEDVPVYAIETEKASCFNQTLAVGHKIITEPPTSIAKCLGSRYVPEKAIELAQRYKTTSMLVTDDEALEGTERFANDHRMIVEPACGAVLSVVYDKKIKVEGSIALVVCGGSAWSVEDIVKHSKNKQQYL